MKKRKTTIIGILCGAFCALAVFLYTNNVQAEALADREEILSRYGGDQVEACVATRDISPGETISSSNVALKTWVAHLLPENAVLSLDEVLGQKVTSSVTKGEVVTSKRFTSEGKTFEAPEGTSALSVPAKDVQAVGGAIEAGMKVDIYATGATSTEILARDVLILSTSASDSSSSTGGFSWVTLALENKSIQEVIAASQKMELYFVLPG